jgi:hypothetical protein
MKAIVDLQLQISPQGGWEEVVWKNIRCGWGGKLFLLRIRKEFLSENSRRNHVIFKFQSPTFSGISVAESEELCDTYRGPRSCLCMTGWPHNAPFATARAVEAAEDHEMSTWIFAIALACCIWYFFILVVQAIGFTQLWVKHQFLGQIILLTRS